MLERRRPDIYGLPVQQAFGKFFWKGMFAGLLVVTFVAGAMILSDGMALHGLALHGSEIAKLGLLWLGANILVGIGEEYTFRGYALQSLWRGAGFGPAALITKRDLRRRSFGKAGRERDLFWRANPLPQRSPNRFAVVGGGLARRV